MKGFPNQVADLRKVALAIEALNSLTMDGHEPTDDGIFGEALVRAKVAGTGRPPVAIQAYINSQKQLANSRQSMRTAARGMRELFFMLGLTTSYGAPVALTALGKRAALTPVLDDADFISFWRSVVEGIVAGEEPTQSHPYQVLLRLVASRPGISRAKCALALEAQDDSPKELWRIAQLSDLDETQILQEIGVTQSNWNNAKKILPSFAEQLGDVKKEGYSFYLSDIPGSKQRPSSNQNSSANKMAAKAPKASRKVTAQTIASAGLAERDEPAVPSHLNAANYQAAIALRAARLKRHNELVRNIAGAISDAELFEDPFDLLAIKDGNGLLIEAKTLNGEPDDERERVRSALAQTLYYEAFVTMPYSGASPVKCAAFELRPSGEHIAWLKTSSINTIWIENQNICCLAADKPDLEQFIDGLTGH